jgi:ATP-binding cassette subfamily B protein
MTQRFTKAVKDYQHQNVNFQTAYSALHIGQQLIFQACLVHTLIESSLKISKGSMDVGAFVTVLAFIMNLFQPLNYLARVYSQIVTSGIDLQNLSELLAQKPDIRDIPNAVELPLHNMSDPEVAVEFDNVSFHYPTQPSLSGLNGLSFKLKRGTSTAIVGSTGSGKTTIGRLLLRLYDTKEGSIKVNGMDVKYINQKSLRNAFGVVPQMVTMFNDTLESNIRYSKREATDEELQIICEQSQLWGFIQSLPEGWNTLVGDRGLKVSILAFLLMFKS